MIVYLFALCVAKLLSALPLGWALALGRGLGQFGFSVVRIRRAVVLQNLRHVFGHEKSEAEIRAIAAEAFRQFGMTVVEMLRSSGSTPSGLEKNFSYDSLDPFHELKASGGPVLFVSPHLGNFDLAGHAFTMQGFPLHTVMKQIQNPRLNDLIMGIREQHDIVVHIKSKDTRQQLRGVLGAGGWLAVFPDQRPHGRRGVKVQFVGKPARIFPGAAIMHLESGAPLCLAYDERLADPRRHHIHLVFLPKFEPTGDRDADVRAIMQQVADRMSAAIRAAPGQYFWFHRLWGKELA